jgi:hypothetical protein
VDGRDKPDHDTVGINRPSLNTPLLPHRRETVAVPGQGGWL